MHSCVKRIHVTPPKGGAGPRTSESQFVPANASPKGGSTQMLRINIGCGQTPTSGWANFDNSISLKLSRIPFLPELLGKIGVLEKAQFDFIEFARANTISYGDATRRLPVDSGSVEVLYSSHMLEHLDHEEVGIFLEEAKRLLRPGGIIRLALPDIRKHVEDYLLTNDADQFIAATLLAYPRDRTVLQKIRHLVVGARHHRWMYDGPSLARLVVAHGFVSPVVLESGHTGIENAGHLNLSERASESVYLEARSPNQTAAF